MGLYTAVAQSIPLLCCIHSEWTIPPRKINWKESLAKPTTYPSVYLDSSCPSYQQLMENYRDPWRINNFYGIYTHVGLHDITWCIILPESYPYSKAGHTPSQNGWSTLKGCIMVLFVHRIVCDEASVCVTPVGNLDLLCGVRCLHGMR